MREVVDGPYAREKLRQHTTVLTIVPCGVLLLAPATGKGVPCFFILRLLT